ncbi:MAG: hypothetical protein IPM64_17255 [Phycisphaerales bacterium]|nr:hypothetical protein [Phycisphaerales bacterium]
MSAGGSFLLAGLVRNVSPEMTRIFADASVRGDSTKRGVVGMRDMTIRVEVMYDPAVATLEAFRAAYFSATSEAGVLALQVLDKLKDGSARGIQGDFVVSSFSKREELDDVQMFEAELRPALTDGAGDVTWITGQ